MVAACASSNPPKAATEPGASPKPSAQAEAPTADTPSPAEQPSASDSPTPSDTPTTADKPAAPAQSSAKSELSPDECKKMVTQAQKVSAEAIDEPGWLAECNQKGKRAKYKCIMAAKNSDAFYRCIGE